MHRPGSGSRRLKPCHGFPHRVHAALAEYKGESPLLSPATRVAFLVTAKNAVDFSGGYDPALDP